MSNDTTPNTQENGADAVQAAQARARAHLPISILQAKIVMLACAAKARLKAEARKTARLAVEPDLEGKLTVGSPNIGQALGVLTMSGVTSLIKDLAIKIDGEWIDTTTMGTTLMSAGDVANKEGQPSVYYDCDLKLKLEYDFSATPPVGESPASCTLAFGPSAAASLAGNATIKSANIVGPLDGAVVMYDAELKFSGLVTLS